MNSKYCMALVCLIITHCCMAQRFYFAPVAAADSSSLATQIPVLASKLLLQYQNKDDLTQLFRLQLLTGKYREALTTIATLRTMPAAGDAITDTPAFLPDELYCMALLARDTSRLPFQALYAGIFRNLFYTLNNKAAYHRYSAFIPRTGPEKVNDDFRNILSVIQGTDSLTAPDALALCRNYYLVQLYQQTAAAAAFLVREDCNRRYTITDQLIKTQDGALIHAVVVLNNTTHKPQPAVLQYTIYADSSNWTKIADRPPMVTPV